VAVDHEEEVVYVLDRGADALFKFDIQGNPVDFGGSSPNISGNELFGLSAGGRRWERQVAVNSSSHTIYVTAGEDALKHATELLAFQSNGEPSEFTGGPGAGTNKISELPDLRGVAVDSNGNIYLSGTAEGSQSNDVRIYSATGAVILPSLAAVVVGGNVLYPWNLAVDSSGRLYVLRLRDTVVRFTPSEYPVTANTTYTESVLPAGEAHNVAIEPVTDRLFVLEDSEGDSGPVTRVAVYDEQGIPEEVFFGEGGEPGELENPDGLAVVIDEAGTSKAFVGNNPPGGLSQVEIFSEKICIKCAPAILGTAVTGVTGDSAQLRAKINPNGSASTYWFEYGLEDCSTTVSPCAKAPADGGSLGAGRRGVFVAQAITGLAAQTTYYYRVVAENEWGKEGGPSRTFTTQGGGLGFALSDSRAWEMVSPSIKHGGTIISTGKTAIQASASGDSLAYASLGSLVDAPASNQIPLPAAMLGKRGSGGEWRSEDLTPPHSVGTKLEGASEYKLFSPDLLRAELQPTDDTPLSPAAAERTPYLWIDGTPPSFTPLVTSANVPVGTEFGGALTEVPPVRIEGASVDLEHVVIRSDKAPLVANAALGSIYIWTGGELKAVSELPESEGENVVEAVLGSGRGTVKNAVSSDGSRVFWTPGVDYPQKLPAALYLRDTVAGKTVRLDVPKGGTGAGSSSPVFNGASADGSVVFFTDGQQLTENASPDGRDLYRCEVGPVGDALGCVNLTNVSPPIEGSDEDADVLSLVPGMSDDGKHVYFAAHGVLDETPNDEGQTATPGKPNLYFWEEGLGPRFVATLSKNDYHVWGALSPILGTGHGIQLNAAISPDGRYFSFPSEASLTGYENENSSGELTTEVFVYDSKAGIEQLTCVSCNPSGAGAVGEQIPQAVVYFAPDPASLWVGRWVAATLPEATETEFTGRSLYRPRSVLNNGRVFFNAIDPLVPADSNGNWDVYQYEPLGVGSCTENASTATVSRQGIGCVGLLSSGTSEGDAGILDASSSGDDVFFLTRGGLSVADHDDEVDVYDARVNGIPAVQKPVQECAGEACQPSVGPPADPTPASESFRGPEPAVKCRKGQKKVHRKGRTVCVRKKHGKHRKHHKGTGESRRAER
jgi:hypothetical protein